jgi:pimeloyl-ACP methyl ester carboxylesterase
MTRVRPSFNRLLLLVLVGVLPATGCTGISVQQTNRPLLTESWRASAITCGELSERSRQTLRRYDLEQYYPDSLVEAANALHVEALRDPRPDVLFALAELSYLRGHKAERERSPDASVFYYLSAGYAYHFLFDEYPPVQGDLKQPSAGQREETVQAGPTVQVFDPHFRLACDLYNASLAKCIVFAQEVGQLDPRHQLVLPAGPGQRGITLAVVHNGFAYKAEEFGSMQLCSGYQVVGLANHHRTYGLGVPLIGSRAANAPVPSHGYYPAGASFPITAFFRFEGTLAELAERRAGWLELFNPLAIQSVQVRGRNVPLETDLTIPLAYYLARTNLVTAGYTGFLNPGSLKQVAGLHSLEPYQPGKIPVVMVHGLFGSPITWAPMFNDLQADPEVRKRFQFWVYFYPTGVPFIASAAELRRDLAQMRQALDPEGKDPALSDMVFVGHSMGGLLVRLMTVNGGDDFWKLVSPDEPFDRVSLMPDARAELRKTFYFERQSFVTRAIYLATPHRGSGISPSVIGRLGARLAGIPRRLMETTRDLAEENPQLAASIRNQTLPSSVDELAPDSPPLQLIAERPRPKQVHYHSVIGVTPPTQLLVERLFGGGYCKPGDGVVPYASAHLDDVDSEVVVPADHYEVHHHPLAILEVRRILLEHARDFDRRQQPIQMAGAREMAGAAPEGATVVRSSGR